MTVYAKIENDKLITAYNGYNGITGLADSIELCEANGFAAYDEREVSGYFAGTYNIVNGVLVDITSTPDYIKAQIIHREEVFNAAFFNIPEYGYYRKKPKGYSSTVESLNTAFNVVTTIGKLPSESLIFYPLPDFSNQEQCTEEWLEANQVKSSEMTVAQFGAFYATFIQAWNEQEHK